MLPKISCLCPTYGRPQCLEEAIFSFLTQDYQGEKELVILNDLADQTLIFDHPDVKIINVKNIARNISCVPKSSSYVTQGKYSR